MSKYIIEVPVDAQYIMINGVRMGDCYTQTTYIEDIEELNSDYINENFGELQDQAYQKGLEEGKKAFDLLESERNSEYQRGLDDAWEAASSISILESNGGLSCKKMKNIFGTDSPSEIYMRHTAAEAINKIKVYEEKQKAEDPIFVGDEVKAEDGTVVFFVTWMSDRCICGVDKEGKCYSYEPKEICGKTGRHFDIASILEEMKHD